MLLTVKLVLADFSGRIKRPEYESSIGLQLIRSLTIRTNLPPLPYKPLRRQEEQNFTLISYFKYSMRIGLRYLGNTQKLY
jgi:hypothetical protein